MNGKTKAAETKNDKITVTLLKDGHTHAGKVRKKGDKIEVTASQAAFLAEHELIKAPGSKE